MKHLSDHLILAFLWLVMILIASMGIATAVMFILAKMGKI